MPETALLDLDARRPGRRGRPRQPSAALTRSALVADFLGLCELDPDVEALRMPVGPAEIVIDGEIIAHTADFELVRDGTVQLVDIVADADLPLHPLRAAAMTPVEVLDGRTFAIATAATIRAEPRFTTMRLIMACRRTPVAAGDRVRILHALDECGTMRLVDCAGAAVNHPDGVAAVLALACEGLIAVEIDRPILPETRVRRRKVAYSDPFGF